MLRNRVYYSLKPLLPRRIRVGIRRWWAARKRKHVGSVWPIMPGSERRPSDWKGWPDGRKFALVLTHDVESQAGVDRVRELMRLEMEMGFRSSFNFIPQGSYTVPSELREELVANGFEVGVHDHRHDGSLFRSFRRFKQNASDINRYLKEWKAVGFRSGFMFNDLNWLQELAIDYDASTFDTDPFEPQPEGRHTIFPFIVPRGGRQLNGERSAYAELPYTLPQDSTLFLFLQEKTPEIWLRKLDWIATHGGMALVNVHPDYVAFDPSTAPELSYPIDHYRALLEHARRTYGDEMWQPLPREVAQHVLSDLPTAPLVSKRRIAMVTYSAYESDNRVMRYAEALAARGDLVDVFALRKASELPSQEWIHGVNVHRIQDRLGKGERSKLDYLLRLLRFLWRARHHLRRRDAEQPYDLLHIHNMPDFLVFAGEGPKRRGAQVILDIHDIVPEFFAAKFKDKGEGFFVRALRHVERWAAKFAHHIIISNHLWQQKYAARTGTADKCSVYINHVDSHVFVPRRHERLDGKLIVLFPGGLYWHQGVDIAIRAFAEVRAKIPQAEFHIYGDGDAKGDLVNLSRELGLTDAVHFFNPVSTRTIAELMATADLGVVPKRADSFGNEAYSTKIMEFMSVGVPVIIAETKIDRVYFDDSVVRFFPSGDAAALAREMHALLSNPQLRQELSAAARDYASRNSWENRKQDYFALVDGLCDGKLTSAGNIHSNRSAVTPVCG
jgi:glycosyltransferase involved in cell wall biosynthesis